ncbi:hypothetical protein F5Y08DRAFT_287597 [Xylaria arbuscula]|nr:hypothetical protein F5Y08DRAFT_287597 [Xylaria arbuscula]
MSFAFGTSFVAICVWLLVRGLQTADHQDPSSGSIVRKGALLGLVNGGLLDPACPNVASHYNRNSRLANYARLSHPVRHAKWLRLLS